MEVETLNIKMVLLGTAVVPDLLNEYCHGLYATLFRLKFNKPFPEKYKFKDIGSSAEGKSLYGQTTIGRAWKVNDKLSMSIAGRAVLGMKKLKGDINVGFSQ